MGPSVIFAFSVALAAFPAKLAAADFEASFFGQSPGKPFETSPEVGDHQETWSRQQARGTVDHSEGTPEHVRDPIEPPFKPVYERGSTGDRRGKKWDDFHQAVRGGQAAHAPTPLPMRERGRAARRWPGTVRAPEATPEAAVDTAEADDLRDAPAALAGNPNAVSLWSGLSRPMMLPAGSVDSVPSSQARELGRIDYENKILGASAAGPDGAIAASEAPVSRPEPKGMRAVMVTLDLSDSPGDIWPALRSLPSDALKLDSDIQPEYVGRERSQALVRGWVPAGKSALLLRSDKILRVEASRHKSSSETMGREPETELLIGVRIPSETSPNEAVRSTLQRLGRTAGFRFKKALAYQQIPGSSQLAVVISGSVPIGNLARVLRDPAVVKVAPAPAAPKRAVVREKQSPKERLASFFIDENPAFLPILLIAAWLLIHAGFSRRHSGLRL